MRELGIDIETFSSVDLLTCGVYAYAESPDFQILIFAYAWDDEPVWVLDLTTDAIPEDLISAIYDPNIRKTAANANFERICLARYLGKILPPEQ